MNEQPRPEDPEAFAPKDLAPFEAVGVPRHLAAGEIVFEEGDPADAFYLVGTGSVSIFRGRVGQPLSFLAHLGVGCFFGEMGLLNDAPRYASARSEEPSRLVRVGKNHFLTVLELHPHLELEVRNTMIQRHHRNVARELDLGRRRDLRIRVDRTAQLTFGGGETLRVHLENLSVGGACLRRVPETWRVAQLLRFTLGTVPEPDLLPVAARVSWHRRGSAGVEFVTRAPSHRQAVEAALRRFLA